MTYDPPYQSLEPSLQDTNCLVIFLCLLGAKNGKKVPAMAICAKNK